MMFCVQNACPQGSKGAIPFGICGQAQACAWWDNRRRVAPFLRRTLYSNLFYQIYSVKNTAIVSGIFLFKGEFP